jgi:hypothetical protein
MNAQEFVGFAIVIALGICVSFSAIGFIREIRFRIAVWRARKALARMERSAFVFVATVKQTHEDFLRQAYVKRRESEQDIEKMCREIEGGKHANG